MLPPDEAVHIWELWMDMRGNTRQGFNGPDPLTYQDFWYHMRVTTVEIPLQIVKIIQFMDNAYLTEYYSSGA